MGQVNRITANKWKFPPEEADVMYKMLLELSSTLWSDFFEQVAFLEGK